MIPALQDGGTKELVLLKEGDRRVSIESNSPALLMEFQTGPDAPLKPVVINVVQEAPIDSYVTFKNEGAKKAFTSWYIETTDNAGNVQRFGPYTQEVVSLPGKSILGTTPEGDYKVRMIGQTSDGKSVVKETNVHIVLWVAPKETQGMRFSIVYEFNKYVAINMYKKYLTDIVIPIIPAGANVIIHGHTDIIGDDDYNQRLSIARANDVKTMLEDGLKKLGRSDVTFQVLGFGGDQKLSPFENKYPEERSYNRTVIIDIIPKQ
jgi:outer membrane protein OmpA-like peptidoglycan-associated protein